MVELAHIGCSWGFAGHGPWIWVQDEGEPRRHITHMPVIYEAFLHPKTGDMEAPMSGETGI